MMTARSDTAVVSTSDGDSIVVIGGYMGNHDWNATCAVELLQVRSRRWYKLTDMPQPLICPSAAICGHQVYVIGNSSNGYSYSLPAPSQLTTQSLQQTVGWQDLPCLPVTDSTVATLCGQLVIVGGKPDESQANTIYQLRENEWEKVGSMASERWKCLVVNLSPSKMMIVGGYGALDSVENCTIV